MDNNKRKVTCVHAQYTEGMSQYHPEGSSKNLVMYGKHLEGVDERGYRLRACWWDKVNVPENFGASTCCSLILFFKLSKRI